MTAGSGAQPLTLWLPMPPDNANGRGSHWASRDRGRSHYVRELDHRAAARLIVPPPAAPFARASVWPAVYYPTRRHLIDSDNLVRRLKPAIDWLKTNGYIAGDDPRRLAWEPVEHRVGEPHPTLSRVRLTLTPLS